MENHNNHACTLVRITACLLALCATPSAFAFLGPVPITIRAARTGIGIATTFGSGPHPVSLFGGYQGRHFGFTATTQYVSSPTTLVAPSNANTKRTQTVDTSLGFGYAGALTPDLALLPSLYVGTRHTQTTITTPYGYASSRQHRELSVGAGVALDYQFGNFVASAGVKATSVSVAHGYARSLRWQVGTVWLAHRWLHVHVGVRATTLNTQGIETTRSQVFAGIGLLWGPTPSAYPFRPMGG